MPVERRKGNEPGHEDAEDDKKEQKRDEGLKFSLPAVLLIGVVMSVFVHFGIEFALDASKSDERIFQRLEGFGEDEDHEAFKQVSTDEVRDYWDGRPCNSGWQFPGIEFGTKEHWEQVKKRKYKVEYHIPAFAEFEKWKGKKVLEVGGGICTTATSFAAAGANITVAELSPNSLALCKKRFETLGLTDRAQFFLVNAEELSSVVPVETYDLVWSFGVIHHSPNPERIIKQIQKYMDEDSTFKIMLYSKISFKLFWVLNHTKQWNFARMDEVVAHYSEAREGSPVTYTYSLKGFIKLLEEFHLTFVGKSHIFPYEIVPYKQNQYSVEPLFRGLSENRWAELEEELGWHLLGEAHLPSKNRVAGVAGDSVTKEFPGLRGILPTTEPP